MKIIKEETKEVIIEQPIRHDTTIERDEIYKDHLVITVDKKEMINIKLEDTPKLTTFINDVQKLKDADALRFKEKYGDINTYAENVNSNDDTYYFISVLQNKRDLSYARGSVVKAMSIASKYR